MASLLAVPQVFLDASGVQVAGRLGYRLYQVAGPASYATGGIPVDLSATFSRILFVHGGRVITTASGANNVNRYCQGNENGTDVFSSGKFRIMSYSASNTPAGTVAAPVFTGSALGGGHVCGALNCDGTHPAATTVPAGTNNAPVFTGSSAQYIHEESNGANLGVLTFEVLVLGILK